MPKYNSIFSRIPLNGLVWYSVLLFPSQCGELEIGYFDNKLSDIIVVVVFQKSDDMNKIETRVHLAF